jgi:hypothetical protein
MKIYANIVPILAYSCHEPKKIGKSDFQACLRIGNLSVITKAKWNLGTFYRQNNLIISIK